MDKEVKRLEILKSEISLDENVFLEAKDKRRCTGPGNIVLLNDFFSRPFLGSIPMRSLALTFVITLTSSYPKVIIF